VSSEAAPASTVERTWWLRAPAVLVAPSAVFVSLRDESSEAAEARQEPITASTRPLHRGRTLIVLETEIERADGALAAKVTQTQAFHYPRG